MPPWLQLVSTVVAALLASGTIARGVATWVWTHTLKRDIQDLRDEISRTNKRIDEWDGSEIWGAVQAKVGNIEVDQKLARQSMEFFAGRLNTLENNFNGMRERRRTEDYRK